jgi:hypothetical protein
VARELDAPHGHPRHYASPNSEPRSSAIAFVEYRVLQDSMASNSTSYVLHSTNSVGVDYVFKIHIDREQLDTRQAYAYEGMRRGI